VFIPITFVWRESVHRQVKRPSTVYRINSI